MSVAIWVIVIAGLVIGFPLSFFWLRRGGPGPQVNWVPRSLRPRVNARYERRGWQKPFDDNGDRNPDRTLL